MSTLEHFIQDETTDLDVEALLSPDIVEMETEFGGTHIYKYLPEGRDDFFETPEIRFTQKGALNDPFELTKRWDQIFSPEMILVFKEQLKLLVSKLATRRDIIISEVKDEVAMLRGTPLNSVETSVLNLFSESSFFQQLIAQQTAAALAFSQAAIDHLFTTNKEQFEQAIERHLSEIGILSLSESCSIPELWARYASRWRGFVVDFNAPSNFFRVIRADGTDHSRLHRVKYSDSTVSALWKNPYYAFLVKHNKAEWIVEQEWRAIRKLSECDRVIQRDNDNIHLWHLPPGTINAIIFGYDYDCAKRPEHMRKLRAYDSKIKFFTARKMPEYSQLEFDDITGLI
jgi:hypothetical protein